MALGVVLVARGRDPAGRGPRRRGTRACAQDIADGIRWLMGHSAVRTLALVILTFNVTWGAAWSVLVLYSTQALRHGRGRLRAADHRGRRRRPGLHDVLRLARAARRRWRP